MALKPVKIGYRKQNSDGERKPAERRSLKIRKLAVKPSVTSPNKPSKLLMNTSALVTRETLALAVVDSMRASITLGITSR